MTFVAHFLRFMIHKIICSIYVNHKAQKHYA
jgi:hypothetical protein